MKVSKGLFTVRGALSLGLALTLVLASACATIVAGGPDHVPISTNPPGAYVYVNATFVGQTPMTASLSRDQPGQIQIYLPGFQPVVVVRNKHLNGWFIASFFFFLVPVIVDLATGNWQRYDDGAIAIGLTPAGGPPPTWYQGPPSPPQPMAPQPPPPQPPDPRAPMQKPPQPEVPTPATRPPS